MAETGTVRKVAFAAAESSIPTLPALGANISSWGSFTTTIGGQPGASVDHKDHDVGLGHRDVEIGGGRDGARGHAGRADARHGDARDDGGQQGEPVVQLTHSSVCHGSHGNMPVQSVNPSLPPWAIKSINACIHATRHMQKPLRV